MSFSCNLHHREFNVALPKKRRKRKNNEGNFIALPAAGKSTKSGPLVDLDLDDNMHQGDWESFREVNSPTHAEAEELDDLEPVNNKDFNPPPASERQIN